MKTWDIGLNSHPDHRIGTVTVYERPWWLSLVEWLGWAVNVRWSYRLKLPRWPVICWDRTDPDNCTCSPREWWGSIGDIVLMLVTNPVLGWVYEHHRNKRYDIKIGYEKARETFYSSDPEFFDREATCWRKEAP